MAAVPFTTSHADLIIVGFGRRRRHSESSVNPLVNSMCARRGAGLSETNNLLDRHTQTSVGKSPIPCPPRLGHPEDAHCVLIPISLSRHI